MKNVNEFDKARERAEKILGRTVRDNELITQVINELCDLIEQNRLELWSGDVGIREFKLGELERMSVEEYRKKYPQSENILPPGTRTPVKELPRKRSF